MTKHRDVNKCRQKEKCKMAALIRQANRGGTKWPISQRKKEKKKEEKKKRKNERMVEKKREKKRRRKRRKKTATTN